MGDEVRWRKPCLTVLLFPEALGCSSEVVGKKFILEFTFHLLFPLGRQSENLEGTPNDGTKKRGGGKCPSTVFLFRVERRRVSVEVGEFRSPKRLYWECRDPDYPSYVRSQRTGESRVSQGGRKEFERREVEGTVAVEDRKSKETG